MTRNGLYRLVLLVAMAAYILIGYLSWVGFPYSGHDLNVCLFKNITGLPCPSCGTTHSLINIIHGHFEAAFMDNPLGLILAICLLTFPVWVMRDWMINSEGFYLFFKYMEAFFRRKSIYVPCIFILIMNWIWNIYKAS